MEKAVAVAMLQKTSERIFTEGKAADGGQIGTYSKAYLKLRLKKNYPKSNKVILQSEKQMVHDWSVISNGNTLGLGFKNKFNANKSGWVEETYNKPIFSHTKEEIDLIDKIIDQQVSKIING